MPPIKIYKKKALKSEKARIRYGEAVMPRNFRITWLSLSFEL